MAKKTSFASVILAVGVFVSVCRSGQESQVAEVNMPARSVVADTLIQPRDGNPTFSTSISSIENSQPAGTFCGLFYIVERKRARSAGSGIMSEAEK